MSQSWIAVLLSSSLLFATAWAGEVTASAPWARVSLPGQKISAAYLELSSLRAGKLVAVASSAAGRAELHEMKHEGGMMKMRQVESIPLPAGQTVKLQPGGWHIMLFDLKAPLAAGQKAPLQLTVAFDDGKQEVLNLSAEVKALNAMPMAGDMPHSMMGR